MTTDDPAVLPVASRAEVRRTIVGLAREHRTLAGASVVVMVVATVASLAVPRLLGEVIDDVTQGRSSRALDRTLLGVAVAVVGQAALAAAGLALIGRFGEVLLASVRERVVERALTVPLADIERGGTGDLLSRVVGDVDKVSTAIRSAIPDVIASTLVVGLTVVGLAVLDPRLALAGLLAGPVQAVTARWYLRRSRPLYAAERAAEGQRSQALHVSVTGARTVRALRLQGRHLRRIDERSQAAAGLAVEASAVRYRFFSGLNVAEVVGLTAILATSFFLVRDGAITVGAATAAALYFHRLFDPVNALLSQLDVAQAASASMARLLGVANLPGDAAAPAAMTGDASLVLEGVGFAYDGGASVLHDLDLRVSAGERVALVGASGAGKTTIAKLVAGIHEPTVGAVHVGGAVALVTQEVHVFAGTLADDLRLAAPEATDAELGAALEVVGAKAWVDARPDGLASRVGEGGESLSATHAQQLALARLVLADRPIAVLDEATAEAGSAGARTLEEAAAAAIEGRTALVIAHRLTQAVSADRVVVLDAGRVVEEGTHDELLASGGPYAELWQAWSAAR